MKRALLSVSDKTGIVELGKALQERGWELLSTGGTARTLRDGGLEVTDVSDVTKHAEMMDGRVKTLHPAIHAGLLARRDCDDDMSALQEHGYGPIDLVAVNLYPFQATIAAGNVPMEGAMGKVDIGGPTMIRAAAKSHKDVWVVVEPDDYDTVIAGIDSDDQAQLRRRLAAKVFRHVSVYDDAVAAYMEKYADWAALPDRLIGSLGRVQTLRYGENPDQEAAFYGPDDPVGLSALDQHHGKELSCCRWLRSRTHHAPPSASSSTPRPAASASPTRCPRRTRKRSRPTPRAHSVPSSRRTVPWTKRPLTSCRSSS